MNKFSFCPLILVLLTSLLAAETYYVSNTGNDNDVGDEFNPWQTLQYAVDNVLPGGTIIVESGFYEGFSIQNSGTALEPCIIRSKSNTNFVINQKHPANLTESLINIKTGTKYWEISGFNIENTAFVAITIEEAENLNLKNFQVSNNDKGIKIIASSNISIIKAKFNNISETAIEIDAGKNIKIINCLFYDNVDKSVDLIGRATDLLFANNTVYTENLSEVMLDFSLLESEVKLLNNIIACDNVNSIVLAMNSSSDSDYNLIFGKISTNNGADVLNLAGWKNLGYDENSVQVQPTTVFRNIAGKDFSLADNSPVCELGQFYEDIFVIENDFAGNKRIQGYYPDLGAYESAIYEQADIDGDRLPNWWERLFGTKVLIPDADEDPDLDDLTNWEEFIYGTDPLNPDTDGDGFSDGDEIRLGTNPLDDSDFPDALTIRPVIIPVMQLRQYFKLKLRYNNGVYPVKFTIIEGSLPSDLKFDEKFGKIEGWLSETGIFECVIEITDKTKSKDTQKIRIEVVLPEKVKVRGCNFGSESNNFQIFLFFVLIFVLIFIRHIILKHPLFKV